MSFVALLKLGMTPVLGKLLDGRTYQWPNCPPRCFKESTVKPTRSWWFKTRDWKEGILDVLATKL